MFSLQRHHNVLSVSATALSARMPTADAYTVIALYTSARHGHHYEHYEFESHAGLPRDVVEKRALEGVQLERGIDPRIVLSTRKSGYFAIAISQEQNSRIIGWSGLCQAPRVQLRRRSQTAKSVAGQILVLRPIGRMECLGKNSRRRSGRRVSNLSPRSGEGAGLPA